MSRRTLEKFNHPLSAEEVESIFFGKFFTTTSHEIKIQGVDCSINLYDAKPITKKDGSGRKRISRYLNPRFIVSCMFVDERKDVESPKIDCRQYQTKESLINALSEILEIALSGAAALIKDKKEYDLKETSKNILKIRDAATLIEYVISSMKEDGWVTQSWWHDKYEQTKKGLERIISMGDDIKVTDSKSIPIINNSTLQTSLTAQDTYLSMFVGLNLDDKKMIADVKIYHNYDGCFSASTKEELDEILKAMSILKRYFKKRR